MKLSVVTMSAEASGDVEINDGIFGLPVRRDVLHRMVEWQRAKRQAGTHKTKTISEIRGTTAKPFRQKGTGRARQGSRRASQMVGGQTVFGPVVRSHAHKLTKKFRVLGLKTALSSKAKDNQLFILDSADLDVLSTKKMLSSLRANGWVAPLIVDTAPSELLVKSCANIKHADVLPAIGLNVLDILKHKELVLTKNALASIEERLA